MDKLMIFFDTHLTPIATKIGSNRYLKAISSGFIAVMAATIVGSLFTLLANLPITAWTTWLSSSGFGAILSLPSQATIDLIALYAVFFIGYSLAKEFDVDGSGAGLTALVCFLLVTGRTSYFAAAATDAKTVAAYATTYLGAKGLFAAIIVGLIGSRIYIAIVKKGWVIKLPDSVPPNVANSFSSLIPAGFVITFFLIVAGAMKFTSYGDLNTMIFTIIQSNLMRFMGNNLFSWLFFNLMTNLLWFFGLHGGNIIGSITNPVYTPLSLENLAAYQAGQTLPYIFTGTSFTKTFTSGGVGSMFGLAILMVLFSKSKQFKILGKLSLPTTLFFINEPLLFGIPVVLNPLFFIPLMLITPILGTLTYFVMKLGIIPAAAGLQLPWTTPAVLHGFMQGGWRLGLWEALMVLSAMAMWYPFFKLADKKALEEENKSVAA
ncbi:MAG: PTS transporter subunit EIIC [Erysipelotrichaceae bacterium]|nr:PTS transporter subunit EIIC [Erysipelotrichaceae bacterium]